MHAARNKFLLLVLLLTASLGLTAQNIPVALSEQRLYDFIDELSTDGVISVTEAVRPYSRLQVAQMLTEAQKRDSLLSSRQRKDLDYYLNEFAIERDTMRRQIVQYTDDRTFNLSLCDPQFAYMTPKKNFKLQLRPILGAEVYGSQKGAVIKRWWGADLKMDIVHHVSLWGSLRDISWNGKMGLSDKYFPSELDKIDGAKLTKGHFLNTLDGVQYKEANYGGDFSDSKGGISIYDWWGSLSLSRENIRWGDAYHASNILSGHNPAVPQVSLQLTPVYWFQFDYFHAWLVSNVLDSTDYYLETDNINSLGGKVMQKEYRQRSKYMAANMFTFKPIKYIHFSFGNSIVYSERTPNAAYFIPIAFFKSLDHLFTKGTRTENQNSQVFATITVRPVDHLKLYTSLFADEISWNRFKPSVKENNPISYVVGFDWGGWPLKGLSLKGEFSRSYIACYTHSIASLEYTSNSYNMGHYMGDNAQSIFLELSYRPIRGMRVSIDYTDETKYNSYNYIRQDVDKAIAQKPFDKKVYRNYAVSANLLYEVYHNMYLTASVAYNNAQGYDRPAAEQTCISENTGTAAYFLNRFSPVYFQGKNFIATAGFSFGF